MKNLRVLNYRHVSLTYSALKRRQFQNNKVFQLPWVVLILSLLYKIFVPSLGSAHQNASGYMHTRVAAKKGFIIDTRTQTTINSAQAKGGGQESDAYYPGWKKINKGIQPFIYLWLYFFWQPENFCSSCVVIQNQVWSTTVRFTSMNPRYNIHMYRTNFCLPTIRLQQNI